MNGHFRAFNFLHFWLLYCKPLFGRLMVVKRGKSVERFFSACMRENNFPSPPLPLQVSLCLSKHSWSAAVHAQG
jgi:hypothetical protein